MKIYFLQSVLLVGLVGCLLKTKAQAYKPIPLNNTSVWWVGTGNYISADTFRVTHFMKYFIKDDTVLNAINYKKLYRKVYLSEQGSGGPDPTWFYEIPPYSGLVGCIRQDSIQRKIYFVPVNTEAEVLLYDFSPKNTGDSVDVWISEKTSLESGSGTAFYGDSCGNNVGYFRYISYLTRAKFVSKNNDTSLWNINTYNYYFKFVPPNQLFSQLYQCPRPSRWIEGVGSRAGLLEHIFISPNMQSVYSHQLICFESNGTIKFPSGNTNKCCCDSLIKCVQRCWPVYLGGPVVCSCINTGFGNKIISNILFNEQDSFTRKLHSGNYSIEITYPDGKKEIYLLKDFNEKKSEIIQMKGNYSYTIKNKSINIETGFFEVK